MKYVMAIDQGTTSSRCIVFDRNGAVKSLARKEHRQFFPQPGWVEHDAVEIWKNVLQCMREAVSDANLTFEDIDSIGITNQRETTVVWDRETGMPVCNAIVWQCRRTSRIVDELAAADGMVEKIRSTTGLVPDAYFSATKIKWILDNVDGAKEKAREGRLLFGTIDSWLIWNLSGGRVHATDVTNASRTMLYDIHKLEWSGELLDMLGIPASMLPEVRPSSGLFGMADKSLFGVGIPISGAAGDQQCALFGQCCFNEGDMKNTYGTGCFMLMNTGSRAVVSKHGLLTTIAIGIGDMVEYALEGSVFITGAALTWLKDELGIASSARECQQLADMADEDSGCYVVPAFTGLGAPYWNQEARGIVTGITRGTGKNELAKATIESIAYQCHSVAKAMEADSGHRITGLKVDGGASANDYLMQFQSDILDCEVVRPTCIETTALGAAYLAGLATGYWKDRADILANWSVDRCFSPSMEDSRREQLLKGWDRSVRTALFWADNE